MTDQEELRQMASQLGLLSVPHTDDVAVLLNRIADRLDEAERDKARLDWLDGEKSTPEREVCGTMWSVSGYGPEKTVREAIDSHLAHVPKKV